MAAHLSLGTGFARCQNPRTNDCSADVKFMPDNGYEMLALIWKLSDGIDDATDGAIDEFSVSMVFLFLLLLLCTVVPINIEVSAMGSPVPIPVVKATRKEVAEFLWKATRS